MKKLGILNDATKLDDEHRAVAIGQNVYGIAKSIAEAKKLARQAGGKRGAKALVQVRPKDVRVSLVDGSTTFHPHPETCDVCTPGDWIPSTL